MLERWIYVSRLAEQLRAPDLFEILDASKRNNTHDDITGLLCFSHRTFVQVLEGPAQDIERLYYERLIHDPRHTQLRIRARTEILARAFPSWSMATCDLTQFSQLQREHIGLTDTSLYDLGARQALAVLKMLRERFDVQERAYTL